MKNIILTVLFILVARSSTALAETTQTEITPKNISHQNLSFEVKFTQKNKFIVFKILVSKKQTNLSSLLDAYLTISDHENQIAFCPIQGFQRDQAISYEFSVSSGYVKNSTFTFGNMAGSVIHPMPSGDFYTFPLDKFIHAAEQDAVANP